MIELAGRVVFALSLNGLLIGLPVAGLVAAALRVAPGLSPRLRHAVCVFTFLVVGGAPVALLLAEQVGRFFADPRAIPATHGAWARLISGEGLSPAAFMGLAMFWWAVTVVLLGRETASLIALRRQRSGWTPLDPSARLALGIPAGVRAWTGERGSPMSLPSLRGEIFLPARWICELEPESLRRVAAHEIDHARWRDPLVLVALRSVRSVLWFSPALVWISRLAIREREAAADSAALRQAPDPVEAACDLAQILVQRAAAARREKRRSFVVAALEDALEFRVHRLLHPVRAVRPSAVALATGWATLALASLWLLPHAPLSSAPRGRAVDGTRIVRRDVDRRVIRDVDRVVFRRP